MLNVSRKGSWFSLQPSLIKQQQGPLRHKLWPIKTKTVHLKTVNTVATVQTNVDSQDSYRLARQLKTIQTTADSFRQLKTIQTTADSFRQLRQLQIVADC